MRVNHVDKSNKDQGKCGKCGTELPKGSAYRWAKGRYTSRKVRCTGPNCGFRPSDLTESKMSGVYAAQESLEDFLGQWSAADGLEPVQSACSEAAEAIREVSEEYATAAEAMSGAGEEMQSKADELESWASDIESAGEQGEEFEATYPDAIECPECLGKPAEGGETVEDSAEHQGEGEYLCKVCNHVFEEEDTNADGQTLEEWADEIRSTVEDVAGSCPV
jgi:rubredoxin/DNA-directed RNA polymerase subunit RPC12/RpoP